MKRNISVLLFVVFALGGFLRLVPCDGKMADYYINVKYLKAVDESKSAKEAQKSCEISSITVKKDSVVVCFDVHEYYEYNTYPIDSKSFYCLLNENDTMKFIYTNDQLMVISSNRTKEIFDRFKIDHISKEPETEVLKKNIFVGSYIDLLSSKAVKFSENGNVDGLLNYKSFYIISDYYDEGSQFDILRLKKYDSTEDELTWKFIDGRIVLYQLDCAAFDSVSGQCGITKIGKLITKLNKK